MMMMMLHDDDADNDDGACSGIGIAILSLKKTPAPGGRAWGIKSPSTTTRVTQPIHFSKKAKKSRLALELHQKRCFPVIFLNIVRFRLGCW